MVNATAKSRPIELLLVEDSNSDAGLTRQALKQANSKFNVHHVQDGEEAMSFLRRGTHFPDAPRPDIIFLDLNMPKKDGREVLVDIRGDSDLESLVVIIVTTSDEPTDVADAYKLRANSYLEKPVDFTEFVGAIQSLDKFWFTHATLPQ